MFPMAAFALLAGALTAAAAERIDRGDLGGAPFAVALPDRWSGFLLLLAPPYRAADRPRTVELDPGSPMLQRLLEDGWMVAKTAYRRNGVILADALSDLDALRDHLAQLHGEPRRVLVEGEGMGGLVSVLLAERETEPGSGARPRYSGVIAVAPALQLREPNSALGLSLQPRIPIVFLCPRSQREGARQYVDANVPRPPGLRPLLCSVDRDGSAAINQAERFSALVALDEWLEQGRSAAGRREGPPTRDLTKEPAPRPSQVTWRADGTAFAARVTALEVETGSFTLDAQPVDLAAAGIGQRTWFRLEKGTESWRVLLARDFSQVRRGEWLAFADGEGWIRIGRHAADAAATAKLQSGDSVIIRRYGPSDAGPHPTSGRN